MHNFPTPPHVWHVYDGTVRVSRSYPESDFTVAPGDAEFDHYKAQADAWDAFLFEHNTTGSPRVLGRTNFRAKPVKVGTVEVREAHEVTSYHAYAADWTTILAEPQTVDLFTDGDSAYWGYTGKVVSGGQNIAGPRNVYGTKIGDIQTVSQRAYTYDVDDTLHAGQEGNKVIFHIDADLHAQWIADRQAYVDKRKADNRPGEFNWDRVKV